MNLTQLSRASGETINWSRLNISFPPDLWEATASYRERREGAGLCRLGTRVVLCLAGEQPIEDVADHLEASCGTATDLHQMINRCKLLALALEASLHTSET